MRIKELAKCAKDDGALTLLDEVDEDGEVVRQYVMLPNRAIYPLDGMPMLNEQTLLTVMDVPREKHSLYEVVRSVMPERARLMVEDATRTDTELRRGTWSLGMNGLTDVVRVVHGDLLEKADEMADVIVANIIADVICFLCGPAKKHLLPGGTFICSGIIREREDDVQAALAAAGYAVCNRLAKGSWVCLAAKPV